MSTPTLEALALKVEALELIVENKFPKTLMAHRVNTVEVIQQIVCDEFNLSDRILLGERRVASYVWPRHIAMALAYEFSGLSTSELARLFDRLDHSTILHAIRRVRMEEVLKSRSAAVVSKVRKRIITALTLQPIK